MTGETALIVNNISYDSDESLVREVVFGPASPEVTILIERDLEANTYTVTIGNGPPHTDVPDMIPPVLVEVAQYMSSLRDCDEYMVAAAAHEAQ